MNIESLQPSDIDEFASYLNDHLQDNGTTDLGYFQPMPAHVSAFSVERAARFAGALGTSMPEPGWRRAWVARLSSRQIIGHVDLRAHPEPHTEHRCLLGLGIDRRFRKQGSATLLCKHAMHWASAEAKLEVIDLQVLSQNARAISLYRSLGFKRVGELTDFFRIDGMSMSYTYMSLRLTPQCRPSAPRCDSA